MATATHRHPYQLSSSSASRNDSSFYTPTSYNSTPKISGSSLSTFTTSDRSGSRHARKMGKSRPNDNSNEIGRQPTAHGKLHKRLIPAPANPFSSSGEPASYYNPSVTASAFEDSTSSDLFAIDQTPTTPKSKTKIKPLLRRFTPRENNSLDLSRSAAEHGGLGIYALDGSGSRSAADVTFSSVGKRGPALHARSTSGASQYSTATNGSNPRPGAQYIHPKRQTPRPYTPPIAQSYTNSLLDSEHSGEGTGISTEVDDGEYVREHLRQARIRAERSHSLSQQQAIQNQGIQPPLRILTTTGSATRLVHGSLPTSTGTPMSYRARADTMSPADTVSPVSRTSMDNVFKLRSKDDGASFHEKLTDERQKFEKKQEAKAAKAEKEALRTAERLMLEREKREGEALKKTLAREERERRKSESKEKARGKGARGVADDIIAQDYATLGSNTRGTGAGAAPQSGVKSRWTAFMVWLRFKLFKLGKKGEREKGF